MNLVTFVVDTKPLLDVCDPRVLSFILNTRMFVYLSIIPVVRLILPHEIQTDPLEKVTNAAVKIW